LTRSNAWDEQVKATQLIAAMAVRLAELDCVPVAVPSDPETLCRRTTELVADLVEPAKAEALEKLGEARQAFGIVGAWVRGKLARPSLAGDTGGEVTFRPTSKSRPRSLESRASSPGSARESP
jgi:hypothetical protein